MGKYFEVKYNVEEFQKKFGEIRKNFTDLTPFLKIIRVKLLLALQENFSTEGTSLGAKWQAWSEKYKKLRIKHGKSGDGVILSDTGLLRKSFKGVIEDKKLTIGTAIEYAAIHNFGHPQRKMPKREYFKFTEQTINEVLEDINDTAKELLEKGLQA